jgi:pimeloyl-ACP methyl ester carboxylesterase
MDHLPEQELVALELFENGRLPEDYQQLVAKVRGLLEAEQEDFILLGLSLGASLIYSLLELPPAHLKGIVACAGQYKLKGNLPYQLQGFIFKVMPRSAFVKESFDKANLIGFYESMMRLDLTEVLSKSQLPALVVCGQKDFFNVKTSKAAANLMPKAQFQMIPSAGHLLTDDAPEALAHLVRGFLAQDK